ncbi:FAD:protein FMN transferase [Dictyobacter arantiisoli]|uniref:FAD:protein FMN transferase n=1 Tax=Dictyobacter arantiisoli TaxID=2014874 RepID=A0A5A5T9C6_9CHLR|nr:FAD:protein FMN transferase [Dictyobacter arantiisoli]GCF08012.1 FAD:protein FMN transferase [Dictyobacter arantiisoli]
MKQTALIMGMPITLEVMDATVTQSDLNAVFAYFVSVDTAFSTYQTTSEISRINRGELAVENCSAAMQTILALSEQTKQETHGYFDIQHNGYYDPSGIVKGWAIQNAASLLSARGYQNFYIDAGGDIQVAGFKDGYPWRVGIRNPFKHSEYVKVLTLSDRGVATSGTAIRGQHIYNPYHPDAALLEIVSLTIIGPNVYEADRFATAAFAMGKAGIQFIEDLAGFEGYMIDVHARATFTSGFKKYVLQEI